MTQVNNLISKKSAQLFLSPIGLVFPNFLDVFLAVKWSIFRIYIQLWYNIWTHVHDWSQWRVRSSREVASIEFHKSHLRSIDAALRSDRSPLFSLPVSIVDELIFCPVGCEKLSGNEARRKGKRAGKKVPAIDGWEFESQKVVSREAGAS